MLIPILHGLILSFGLIIPLGPQNILVFSEGVEAKKYSQVWPVVVAAAICDSILISVAVLGVGALVFNLPEIKISMVIFGVIFLAYMGYISLKRSRRDDAEENNLVPRSKGKRILYTIGLSLLNPHAIIDSMGVIGTSAVSYNHQEKIFFTIASIANSWAWFILLSFIGYKLGGYGALRKRLNLFSAYIMWVCAMLLLKQLF